MRHSRKAVMAERYKLYMKKNIFNGRYLVRNIQILVCAVLVIALVAGAVVLSCFDKDEGVVTASASVGVKEALFGKSEEKKVTKKQDTEKIATTESTEKVVAEADTEEADTEESFEENVSAETIEAGNTEEVVQPEKEQKEKSEFEGKCIANVDETLNIRKEPSAEAEFVGSMNRGAIAKVESTEGEWAKIKSGDVEGYVLSQYVLTGEEAEKLAKDYVTLRGTVLEDGVNVRTNESTDSEILTVLDKDDTITVLESPEEGSEEKNGSEPGTEDEKELTQTEVSTETQTAEASTEIEDSEVSTGIDNSESSTGIGDLNSDKTSEDVMEKTTSSQNEEQETTEEQEDEITWIPVALEDGQTGYVAADFVKVESLYELAISAEELERQALEAARKAAEEEAARQAAAEAAAKQTAAQTSNSTSGNTSNTANNNNDTYEGATTKPVTTTEAGECIGTFTITAYCGCKKCSGGSQKTASGTTPTEGRTIAADTSILPFGTKVVIGGVVYTVEDRGSGVNGNHIDIFFATHSKALAFGRKSMKVYKY